MDSARMSDILKELLLAMKYMFAITVFRYDISRPIRVSEDYNAIFHTFKINQPKEIITIVISYIQCGQTVKYNDAQRALEFTQGLV